MHLAQIVDDLLARLRDELANDLLGVLIGGSRLRGEGDNSSDLDVVVIIARPERRRWNIVVRDVEIEMFVNPLFQMRRYFESERATGRGQMAHLISTGRIVLDAGQVMSDLQSEARAIWESGPPPLSNYERWRYRYGVADSLRDIEDVSTIDPERTSYLLGSLLPQLVDIHYRIAGRWLHKPKRALLDIATWDPRAANLARASCGTSEIGDRCSAIRELAIHVLGPLGGIMPLEWGTDWEAVSPGLDSKA